MSRYLIHPFLIGSFPVLYLYSRNFEQVGFSDVLAPLMTSVLLSLLILLVTRRVLRDARKAGLITSAFLVWFFSYGHLYEIVETLPFARHRYILAVTGLGLLTVIYYVLKSKIELGRATTALNYISILLTFNCVVYYGLQHGNLNEIEAKIEVISGGNANVTDTRPDIYYIILDAYAGGETLNRFFGFDNRSFLDYLKHKGFYVAPESRSNYTLTILSLASALNMEYVPISSEYAGEKRRNYVLLKKFIDHNRVQEFLRQNGYKFIHIGSSDPVTELNQEADINIQCGRLGEYTLLLMRTTIVRSFWHLIYTRDVRERILCTFGKILEAADIEGPKFVFAHVLSPHPPYVFGRNGERVNEKGRNDSDFTRGEQEKYLNQLIFINQKVEEVIDQILARPGKQPIIILQGDHGPTLTADKFDEIWSHPDGTMIRERMMILNAYYFPGGNGSLYSGITPVNSFRLLFDRYFGTNYGAIMDHSFYSAHQKPYEFRDVTLEVGRGKGKS